VYSDTSRVFEDFITAAEKSGLWDRWQVRNTLGFKPQQKE